LTEKGGRKKKKKTMTKGPATGKKKNLLISLS